MYFERRWRTLLKYCHTLSQARSNSSFFGPFKHNGNQYSCICSGDKKVVSDFSFKVKPVEVKIYDIKFLQACWKPHTDKKFILYAAQPSQFFSTFLNQPGICRKPKGQKSVNQHIIFTALIRCNLIWKVWIRNWFRKLCYGFTPILHGKIIF